MPVRKKVKHHNLYTLVYYAALKFTKQSVKIY